MILKSKKLILYKFMFEEAWLSIKSNKLRSFLTTLGIIIGVFAVVLMVAVGETVQSEINKIYDGVGANILFVSNGFSRRGRLKSSNSLPFKIEDAGMLSKLRYVSLASPIIQRQEIITYGSKTFATRLHASDPNIMEIGKYQIAKGQGITDEDVKVGALYIVIGKTAKDELFGDEDPIGKTIRMRNTALIVKGIIKERGSNLGVNLDDVSIMPITTYRRRINPSKIPNSVDFIGVSIDEQSHIPRAKIYIANAIRAKRKLREGIENNFEIFDMKEQQEQISLIASYFSILLFVIAFISLVVGSIGIMNMMLVSVTERTREIGIRKALGANNQSILSQFLIEAIIISLLGSVVGMILGIGISQIAGLLFDVSVPFSFITIVVSFMVAVIVGISSGLFPAIKATKLNPIDALRYQ